MYNLIPTHRSMNTMNSLVNFFDAFDRDLTLNTLMRTDILDEGDHLTLRAELPGYAREDLDIETQNGILTISASHEDTVESGEKKYLLRERRMASLKRSFQLDGVDETGITAEFQDGVLTLSLPKEAAKMSRKIELA